MCAFAALTVVTCAGLIAAAVLVPAPAAVVPFLTAVCVAAPMVAAWELRGALAVLRGAARDDDIEPRLDSRALIALRRTLKRLPETRHPLGL